MMLVGASHHGREVMGASNTPIPDLIELDGISVNTTYTGSGAGGGRILGLVDNATYTDLQHTNSATEINEINETSDADHGYLYIDGVEYAIELASPAIGSSGDVDVVTETVSGYIPGSGDDSDIVFIIASPTGGGATRYFALMDDAVGDIGRITSLTTGDIDWTVSGQDATIDVDQDNNQGAVCFAAGTRIDTPEGARAVEDLSAGDTVSVLGGGTAQVLYIRRRVLTGAALRARPSLRPVRIAPGALGTGVPRRAVVVSLQHRLLIRSKIAERMFNAAEVLVPAGKLTALDGIAQLCPPEGVIYFHLLCQNHEIVMSDGLASETLMRGAQVMEGLDPAARRVMRLLPGAGRGPARPICERRGQIDRLIERHVKNGQPLYHA